MKVVLRSGGKSFTVRICCESVICFILVRLYPITMTSLMSQRTLTNSASCSNRDVSEIKIYEMPEKGEKIIRDSCLSITIIKIIIDCTITE